MRPGRMIYFMGFLCFLFPLSIHASDPIAIVTDGNDALSAFFSSLSHLPLIGPSLLKVMNFVGLISAIFTPLSYFAQFVLRIPEVIARFSAAPALADKIKYWSDKIIYWLSFFSIRNAKK